MMRIARLVSPVLMAVLIFAGISEPAFAQSGISGNVPPPPAVQTQIQTAVEAFLTGRTNVPGNSPVRILSADPRSWPDSCLGLDRPGVDCLEVVTDGYLVKAAVNGLLYTIRTNRTGTQVLYQTAIGPVITFAPDVPVAVQAVGQLAGKFLVSMLGWADSVQVISIEDAVWPDSCLGVQQAPGTNCAAVAIPGYRVVLVADGNQYIVRTDKTGSDLAIDPSTPVSPVLGAPPLTASMRIFLPAVQR